jgi:hypothetical protein
MRRECISPNQSIDFILQKRNQSIMKYFFALFILLVQQGIGQNVTEDSLFNSNDTYVNQSNHHFNTVFSFYLEQQRKISN